MNPLLNELRGTENFKAIMSDMLGNRPIVPEYTPQDTIDQTANLIETIKYKTAQRAGFDLLFTILTGSKP